MRKMELNILNYVAIQRFMRSPKLWELLNPVHSSALSVPGSLKRRYARYEYICK